MKKILLASAAALAMTGGYAAADVNVSGSSRFGASLTGGAWTLNHRTRLNFTLSGQADHFEFGAFTRVQITNTGTTLVTGPLLTDTTTIGGTFSGSHIWVGAEGFRLTMGNTDAAIASRVALYGGGLGYTGAIGWGAATHAGYTEFTSAALGTNTVMASYDNSGFGISASIDYTGGATAEIAASYAMDGISVAAGWRQGGNWSASGSYAMDDITIGALISRAGVNTNYRIWGTYAMGDITLGATYANVAGGNYISVGGNYNLGGGARAHAAVGSHLGAARAEVGMTFAF